MNNNISYFYPTFEWQHLKQSQHSISYIIKVKVTRIGPEKENNGHVKLYAEKNNPRISSRKWFTHSTYQTLGTQKPGLFSPGFSFRLRFLDTLTFMRNIPWQSSYKQTNASSETNKVNQFKTVTYLIILKPLLSLIKPMYCMCFSTRNMAE